MARSVVKHFAARRVFDAGCGSGGLLVALREAGVAECRGIDFSTAAVARCRERGLDVSFGDLSRRQPIDQRADLCICFEVAEHLPAEAAEQLVKNLAGGPGLLLFTAAPPGQRGHMHLNEQPPSYWIEKLERRNFRHDAASTEALRGEWGAADADVAPWFVQNLLVFRRK